MTTKNEYYDAILHMDSEEVKKSSFQKLIRNGNVSIRAKTTHRRSSVIDVSEKYITFTGYNNNDDRENYNVYKPVLDDDPITSIINKKSSVHFILFHGDKMLSASCEGTDRCDTITIINSNTSEVLYEKCHINDPEDSKKYKKVLGKYLLHYIEHYNQLSFIDLDTHEDFEVRIPLMNLFLYEDYDDKTLSLCDESYNKVMTIDINGKKVIKYDYKEVDEGDIYFDKLVIKIRGVEYFFDMSGQESNDKKKVYFRYAGRNVHYDQWEHKLYIYDGAQRVIKLNKKYVNYTGCETFEVQDSQGVIHHLPKPCLKDIPYLNSQFNDYWQKEIMIIPFDTNVMKAIIYHLHNDDIPDGLSIHDLIHLFLASDYLCMANLKEDSCDMMYKITSTNVDDFTVLLLKTINELYIHDDIVNITTDWLIIHLPHIDESLLMEVWNNDLFISMMRCKSRPCYKNSCE
jgi:hypothetical protein